MPGPPAWGDELHTVKRDRALGLGHDEKHSVPAILTRQDPASGFATIRICAGTKTVVINTGFAGMNLGIGGPETA